MPNARDFWKSKTTGFSMIGIGGGITAALYSWVEKQDWKAMLASAAFGIYSAIQMARRDTSRRGDEEIVDAICQTGFGGRNAAPGWNDTPASGWNDAPTGWGAAAEPAAPGWNNDGRNGTDAALQEILQRLERLEHK